MDLFKRDVRGKDYSSVEAVVQGNIGFALDLYQKLRTAEGNLFFSPYSISTALAMTYAGARGNTEVQMAQVLRFPLAQERLHPVFGLLEAQLDEIGRKGHIQLRVANALWPKKGYALLEEFLALTKQYYGVLIRAVDYGEAEAARRTINGWVEDKTQRKIKDIIPPGLLDELTRLVLVNAIYFKGDWASQFDRKRTRQSPFWVTPDGQVRVPMMSQQSAFRYGEGADIADADPDRLQSAASGALQVLELPYAGGDLSMVVLLPREIDGLAALEEHLTVENLARWTGDLRRSDVQVFLPRFEMTCAFGLGNTLMSMGMVDAFGDADFSGMDGTRSLYIGAVLHKAFVAVNEEGTEAAAATAVAMRTMALSPPVPAFRADHPFVFLIRENSTGSLLFLGRVVGPG